jgi:predicted RNA-binding protein with RPS1 domain
LKKTQEDPWRQFARLHQTAEVIEGDVTKLVPFGAFVRVADGIEGLVHISELAHRHVETAEQVVKVGDKVPVKIIEIDSERRRISLSIRQATEAEVEAPEDEMQLDEGEEAAAPAASADAEPAEAAQDVLEAALAPEVEPREEPAGEGDEEHARPLGEETIEAIVADLKRRTGQSE